MGFVVILLLLAGSTLLAIRAPLAALMVSIFLAQWNGLQADFGVTVFAYQLASLPLTLVVLVRSLRHRPRTLPASGWLAAFVLYAVLISLGSVGFLPDASVEGGALRSPIVRAFTQIPLFLFFVAPALVVPLVARRQDIAACARVFVASSVVLAVIGWGQLAVWYATGSNPIQVADISKWLGGNETYSRQGAFDFAKLAIYRMNSFAGEPRQMGITLAVTMLLIQLYALTAKRPRPLLLFGLWLFMLASAVATYSTSAVALWLIGSAVELAVVVVTRTRVQRSTAAIVAVIIAIVTPIGIGIAAADAQGIPVIEILSERTVDRIDENGAVEDFDLAILDFLKAHPRAAATGVGIGNSHLYATQYLDPEFAIYAEGTVFTAKSEYLRLLSETGIIGLALFLLWHGALMLKALKPLRGDPELAALVPFSLLLLVLYLVRVEVVNEFWLTAGLAGAAVAGARRTAPARVAARLAAA